MDEYRGTQYPGIEIGDLNGRFEMLMVVAGVPHWLSLGSSSSSQSKEGATDECSWFIPITTNDPNLNQGQSTGFTDLDESGGGLDWEHLSHQGFGLFKAPLLKIAIIFFQTFLMFQALLRTQNQREMIKGVVAVRWLDEFLKPTYDGYGCMADGGWRCCVMCTAALAQSEDWSATGYEGHGPGHLEDGAAKDRGRLCEMVEALYRAD
ncbi:hypothetical protein PPACK8108_LOCUS9463 [Phakopsora pachyrhizi]|uniref:Uncharacterized protein n=1 Tax=Phakopsora pachyrhizi TaxID=170000 RepID=A0AAV0AZE5_PHAPC|nr:hypothetical protein PPACK8108_LOCUS9463 [Phakopsora pachyrhizi]